jgi:hypothetical protein
LEYQKSRVLAGLYVVEGEKPSSTWLKT